MVRSLLCFLIAPMMCLYGQAPKASDAGLDWVQQSFPGEAARVLAYVRNLSGAKIGDVAATLERSDASGAAWKVEWRDATGKTIRERRVEVDATRVEEGAAFYREVLAQLTGDDWAIQSASPDNSATAFWQGAEMGAVSRTEAILGASKLLADKHRVERAADAARLAGVLIHAAVPSLAGRRPIDSRLLARGAAWLGVAEKRLHEPLTAAWAPVLFLAGRESEAGEIWRSPDAVIKKRTAAERFWAVALKPGTAQETFNFAARKENRSWAMPAMFVFVRKDARLARPVGEIVASWEKNFADRLHDYTPVVSDRATADAAWQKLRSELAATPAEAAQRKLAPIACISVADLADAAAPAPASAGNGNGTLADVTDAEIATLAKDALAAAAEAPAESATPSATPNAPSQGPTPLEAMPKLTTANEMWAYLQKFKSGPGRAASPEDGMRRIRDWLDRQRNVAEQFVAKYPDDPRRWEAQTIGVEAGMHQSQFGEGKPKEESAKVLEQVLDAPGVSKNVKGTAAFLRVMLDYRDVDGMYPHTLPPFHRKLSEFLAQYPEHPRAVEAAGLQIQLLRAGETPGADKILEGLSKHANPAISVQAKAVLEQRARFSELKKKPLDLKFTASSGETIDLAKLRGKVVLLDFWASWCGPCMAEAPNVGAVYKKLHERGFEIVGICLDQDRAAMEGAIQRAGLSWPHHFDGKGWENEIAQRFGIRSIPATWLFDKQGKLREIGLRGEELEPGVERLLRE